jgi:hypothetical protein
MSTDKINSRITESILQRANAARHASRDSRQRYIDSYRDIFSTGPSRPSGINWDEGIREEDYSEREYSKGEKVPPNISKLMKFQKETFIKYSKEYIETLSGFDMIIYKSYYETLLKYGTNKSVYESKKHANNEYIKKSLSNFFEITNDNRRDRTEDKLGNNDYVNKKLKEQMKELREYSIYEGNHKFLEWFEENIINSSSKTNTNFNKLFYINIVKNLFTTSLIKEDLHITLISPRGRVKSILKKYCKFLELECPTNTRLPHLADITKRFRPRKDRRLKTEINLLRAYEQKYPENRGVFIDHLNSYLERSPDSSTSDEYMSFGKKMNRKKSLLKKAVNRKKPMLKKSVNRKKSAKLN